MPEEGLEPPTRGLPRPLLGPHSRDPRPLLAPWLPALRRFARRRRGEVRLPPACSARGRPWGPSSPRRPRRRTSAQARGGGQATGRARRTPLRAYRRVGQQRRRDRVWRFDELPATDFRQVIETNLFGQVHGARAAIPRFRRQGSGGVDQHVIGWGRGASPYVSAYVTSKFAVRAFSECLRCEVEDCPDVHVATMLPQAVDTPISITRRTTRGARCDRSRRLRTPTPWPTASCGARSRPSTK